MPSFLMGFFSYEWPSALVGIAFPVFYVNFFLRHTSLSTATVNPCKNKEENFIMMQRPDEREIEFLHGF